MISSPKSPVSAISVFYLQPGFAKGLYFWTCDIKFEYSGVWRWYTEYNSGPNFKNVLHLRLKGPKIFRSLNWPPSSVGIGNKMENLLRWDCLKGVFLCLRTHTVPNCSFRIKMFEKSANSLHYVILDRKRPKGVSVTSEGKIGEGMFVPVHTMQTYK